MRNNEKSKENNQSFKNEPELIIALAKGMSVRAAAKASGFSERSVYRRLQDPPFLSKVSNAQSALLRQGLGRAVSKVPLAWETLSDVASDSENDNARVIAARTILELSHKLGEGKTVAKQIESIEQRLRDLESQDEQ
jgi:hypothetical protein